MSITDELRKYADRLSDEAARKSEHGFSPVAMALEAIADRIDAEHERITHNLTDALHKQEDATRELDEKSVLLPVDADGVPIRVGDVMETEDNSIRKVDAMQVSSRKWSIGLVTPLDATFSWHDADRLRHHHKPTVEDVLREFAEKITDSQIPNVHPTYEEAIAEYAAKLRLAGDAE